MKLGIATKRPEQVIGIHFFNPVPVLRLVELVVSLMTSPATIATADDFATNVLRKRVIRSQDRAGFVVNALLIPYLLSAIRMMESGFATADDIDTGMVEGCNHPMGPLHLADLIGLDTTLAVAESLLRGVQGAALRTAADVVADGRSRSPRTQDRPRVLRLCQVNTRTFLWPRLVSTVMIEASRLWPASCAMPASRSSTPACSRRRRRSPRRRSTRTSMRSACRCCRVPT